MKHIPFFFAFFFTVP
ncbi:pheA operon leader peptide PheL [Budvicia aquatica]|nr:pheA operon leader peptide PheL [Budvicia aquatica]MBP9643475.1 pheA operon leader peptide PheL [Budvicia sp.]